MTSAVLAVFVMGLRHGADPDHLAAIDNLTRNAAERMPVTSRLVGTFFAVGHSAMVLGIASAAAAIGSHITLESRGFERVGALASIGVLLLMAAFNIATLLRPGTPALRARFLPKVLRDATHPLIAIPIGALFGFGFETSSQLVAYGLAFSSRQVADGLIIGALFCLGMICTDTFDSLFVARMIGSNRSQARRSRSAWILVTTTVALAVAVERSIEFLGFAPPIDELALSGLTVAALVATAIAIGASRWFGRDLAR